MPATDLAARLAGVFAPISTPFDHREDVDYSALAFNMEFYAASGLRGYLALGSNGENRSLTEEEKLRVLGEIVRRKSPTQVAMAGATYDAQRDTERFLDKAADMGADFGLVLSPGYFRTQMTEDVLFRYFTTVADRSRLPILLYNAPGFCGVTLTPALAARLAAHPNIVGMKDSASSGIENFLGFESGTVSLANSFPALALELFACGAARDEQRGPALQERVSRINHSIAGGYGPPGVKAAMNLAGLRGGIPRRPLQPLTPAQVEKLAAELRSEGLIS